MCNRHRTLYLDSPVTFRSLRECGDSNSFGLYCTSGICEQQWTKVYENDHHGDQVSGSLSALRTAIIRGSVVRTSLSRVDGAEVRSLLPGLSQCSSKFFIQCFSTIRVGRKQGRGVVKTKFVALVTSNLSQVLFKSASYGHLFLFCCISSRGCLSRLFVFVKE